MKIVTLRVFFFTFRESRVILYSMFVVVLLHFRLVPTFRHFPGARISFALDVSFPTVQYAVYVPIYMSQNNCPWKKSKKRTTEFKYSWINSYRNRSLTSSFSCIRCSHIWRCEKLWINFRSRDQMPLMIDPSLLSIRISSFSINSSCLRWLAICSLDSMIFSFSNLAL